MGKLVRLATLRGRFVPRLPPLAAFIGGVWLPAPTITLVALAAVARRGSGSVGGIFLKIYIY
jgi:hypothetical protein